MSTEREAFEAKMRCEETWGHRSLKRRPDGCYQNWRVDLMWDLWQARAQVQGEPVTVAVDHFDNGPFEAYTNRIYPHVEIGTKLYTASQLVQATQAEVTDEQIKEAAVKAVKDGKLSWLGFEKDDQDKYTIPVISKSHYQFARAILALRPERVPMTDEQINEMALQEEFLLVCDGFEELTEIVRAVEAHHGIPAQAKKEIE